jgi:hypothetical protein
MRIFSNVPDPKLPIARLGPKAPPAVNLGEFGANDKGGLASRVRWTEFMARPAEKRGWSGAYGQLDSEIIVYDMSRQQWVRPIRDALIPARKQPEGWGPCWERSSP